MDETILRLTADKDRKNRDDGPSPLPPDVLLRLCRADEHVEALRKGLWTYFVEPGRRNKPYRLSRRADPKKKGDFVVLELVEPIPRQFALMASDPLHNLRASLDNLIFALAGSPDRDSRNLSFPVWADDPRQIPDRLGSFDRSIAGLPNGAKAIVQALQPYARPDDWHDAWPYQPRQDSLLAVLSRLSNIDKHRVLHTFLMQVQGQVGSYPSPLIEESLVYGPLREPIIGRLRPDVADDLDVNREIYPLVSIAFSDGGRTISAADQALTQMADFIRETVLPQFEPFFRGGVLIRS